MRKPAFVARICFALLIFFAAAGTAIAQEGPFVIKDVDFQVKGRTLSFVLMQKLKVDGPVIGRSFADKDALDAYVADRRQILLNTRLFASVDSSYDLSPSESGGSEVKLRFAIIDTWNIVALPKPVISSNTGVDLYVKGKDYNFLGSMQTLSLAPDAKWDRYGNFSGSVTTSFSVPFESLGADWDLGVSETAQLWNAAASLSETSLGLTYNIPDLAFPASITASQGYNYYADLQYPGYPEPDPDFLTESLSGTFHLPIGVSMGSLGMVYWDPDLVVTENWWPTAAMYLWGRAGPSFYLANMLSTGRLDWIGNMRQGATLALTTKDNYNIQTKDLIQDISVSATGTWHAAEKIGFTTQVTALARPLGVLPDSPPPVTTDITATSLESLESANDTLTGLGSYLRGIVDDRIFGDAGIFANFSVPIKLFDFPTHVLIKKDWLDFELQAQPFFDAAAVLPWWGATFSTENKRHWLWASGGLELLFFPDFMKNFIIRFSLGWDLISLYETHSLTAQTWDGSSPYEYYIGTGLAY
jgi:hypothetical protein